MASSVDSSPDPSTAILIVDHGSRRAEANETLLEVAALFERLTAWEIVEPAHMELAAPTIGEAFDRCVARGATSVICFPYFLAKGRHWDEDIPELMRRAGLAHPDVSWRVTEPLGLHASMVSIMSERIASCLTQANAPKRVEPDS